MQTIWSILLTLLILTFIVVVHEWGHFIVARACGVFVEEFSIGMGPKLFGFKTKKDMEFSVRLLPIGGYCRMKSRLEDELDALSASPADSVEVSATASLAEETAEETVEVPADPAVEKAPAYGQYNMEDISAWKRILMFLAGPLMNFILALVLSTMLSMIGGFYQNKISAITPNSSAEGAGLKEGDVIVSIDGEWAYNYYKANYILDNIQPGTEVEFVVLRDGKRVTVPMASRFMPTEDRYLYGFSWTPVGSVGYELSVRGAKQLFPVLGDFIAEGFWEIVFNLDATVDTLLGMITGRVSTDNVSGVIGVVSIVGDVVEQTKDYGFWIVVLNMVNIAMLLSASLCIMNLMPIPALDGGQIIIVIIEKIIGHPLSAKARTIVAIIGWVMILALMVLVCFNDISKLFR